MSLLSSQVYANTTTPCWSSAPAYGSFSSTQTQVVGAGVLTPAVYDTTDITPSGVSLISGLVPGVGSVIRVASAGVYKIVASAQCDRTAVGLGDLEMFPTNGVTPFPNSATRVQINQNQELSMTVEWLLELDAGGFFNILFFSSTAGQRILSIPATVNVPAVPSIIVTVVKVA